jgi:hypothetical protein
MCILGVSRTVRLTAFDKVFDNDLLFFHLDNDNKGICIINTLHGEIPTSNLPMLHVKM